MSRAESSEDETAREQAQTFLRKESCRWKRSQSTVGTRLESDRLIVSRAVPPWQRKMGREEATEIERHGVERERKIEHRLESIVERGHRVRRDDLLSSLRLLAGIVNIGYR